MTYCSLDQQKKRSNSCLSTEHLRTIYTLLYDTPMPNDKYTAWKKIEEKFRLTPCSAKTDTEKELCILTDTNLGGSSLVRRIVDEAFKPPKPDDPNGWLSNFDIKKVMNQLEKSYNSFLFLGPVASDIEDYVSQLTGFSIEDIYKKQGKAQIGIVYNMDTHDGPGTHWTATFIEISSKKATVEYYDSLGNKPPEQIDNFLKTIKNNIEKMGIPTEYLVNKINHQREDKECGVFSMSYILDRLNGKTFNEIISDRRNDRDMDARRNYYFR